MVRSFIAKVNALPWIPKNALWVFLALVFVWALAPLTIRLPFSPVPIVMQSNAMMFCAVLLGSQIGTLNALLFVGFGVIGVPIWSAGGHGWETFVGPKGGYLVGYILGSLTAGLIAEYHPKKTPARDFIAMALGTVVINAFGFAWLAQFLDPKVAFLRGILPFIPGNCIKLVFFLLLLKYLPLDRYPKKEMPS